MKRCGECNAIYEDQYDICPTCGEKLESYTQASGGTTHRNTYSQREENSRSYANNQQNSSERSSYVFEQQNGANVIINGAVVEANTQQYYQSKFTKIIQALFSGEPYQLSHTSFVTIFRVEEHTMRGYPEHARDITVYGNTQNLFAVGDDVTVEARRRGNRYVAKRIYNHSIDSNMHIQPYIPAGAIWGILIAIIALIIMLISSLPAIGAGIIKLIGSLMPVIVVIGIFWYVFRSFFKKK